MAHWRRIIAQLRSLLANKRAEEDLAREVASHLTLLADDFERRGMSPEEAQVSCATRLRRRGAGKTGTSRRTLSVVDRTNHAGPALWPAHIEQEPRLHHNRGAHARPRHRRVHGHLQPGECGAHPLLALRGSEPARLSLHAQSAVQTSGRSLRPRLRRLLRPETARAIPFRT